MSTLTDRHLKVPKYLQLAEQLKKQIESGALRPDDRLPSFPQLRAKHGVTNSTVEKVYALLERDGLIVRQPSRGTFVAHPGQGANGPAGREGAARPGTTPQNDEKPATKYDTIGVSGLGFTFAGTSTYWSRLLQGMQETANRKEAQVMLLDHTSLAGWAKADGVLLCDFVSEHVLAGIPEGMPRIALMGPIGDMPTVMADDYNGGRLATEHLLALGHRRIAYLYLHGEISPLVARRQAGYHDALRAAGVTPDPRWMRFNSRPDEDYGHNRVMTGHRAMQAWLEDDWEELGCTAVLAHNDEVAFGVMEALREAGLDVPGDLSVMGYDNIAISEYCSPPLTTISVPLQQIANTAAQLLLQRIELAKADRPAPVAEHHILPVRLEVRASTAPPRARPAP